ncbi:MAG: cupin domain-containing protein [Gammaproteobacteria bacterium]|nr:cupin domain-containing protein [Gammaproteobacteria bacterium]
MKRGNLFEAIPAELEKEVFESLIENGNVRIERIISNGHRSPESGWYDQQQNEWVLLLKGEATIAFASDVIVELGPGDYIDIPSHTRHKVIGTSSNSATIWLAVHY